MAPSLFALAALVVLAGANVAPLRCPCTRQLEPTCGSDGITYPNACMLKCASRASTSTRGAELRELHPGACAEQKERTQIAAVAEPAHLLCMCRQTRNPVCGTDGVTYNNICSLRCAAGRKAHTKEAELAVAHEGACSSLAASADASPAHLLCMCRQTKNPVCGTDGVTYNNICSLRCAAGRKAHTKEAELAVAHEGACSQQAVTAEASISPAHLLCMCRQTVSPVCGTDGVTYTNICSLRCAAGRKAHTKEAELAVAHEGACVNADKTKGASAAPKTTRLQCMCGPVLSPVCGSDGVTYPNICILKCNAGRRPKAAAELAVAHAGVC